MTFFILAEHNSTYDFKIRLGGNLTYFSLKLKATFIHETLIKSGKKRNCHDWLFSEFLSWLQCHPAKKYVFIDRKIQFLYNRAFLKAFQSWKRTDATSPISKSFGRSFEPKTLYYSPHTYRCILYNKMMCACVMSYTETVHYKLWVVGSCFKLYYTYPWKQLRFIHILSAAWRFGSLNPSVIQLFYDKAILFVVDLWPA